MDPPSDAGLAATEAAREMCRILRCQAAEECSVSMNDEHVRCLEQLADKADLPPGDSLNKLDHQGEKGCQDGQGAS
jgi:hypothetical protein